MSRIGKLPVKIIDGVDVKIDGSNVTVKGKLGTLEKTFHPAMSIEKIDDTIVVKRPDDSRTSRSLHGLTRSLLNNMVEGVSIGFQKSLVITGVGYRCALKGNNLDFTLGYSHGITVPPPDGITFVTTKPTEVTVKGIDKEVVGLVAANIRSLRKPEPYKGKGIRYSDERIIRKSGKAASK